MMRFLLVTLVMMTVSWSFAPPLWAETTKSDWSYIGDTKPQNWGSLNSAFRLCSQGQNQSPINLNPTENKSSHHISFHYAPVPLEIVNNGHTIQINYAQGSLMRIDGENYQLLQFHFHHPSEHQIAGKLSAIELHFVHRNSKGKLAVVALLMEAGKPEPNLTQIWHHLPLKGETKTVENVLINALNFFPDSPQFYHYQGSLTTPPCDEIVEWFVLTKPLSLSPAQIAVFTQQYPFNARPMQKINGRKIELQSLNFKLESKL